ncbi:MAG TPA: TonB-dependent receptor [Candidatus Eisenbacteria bacterium]|jgi:outer membrane receptor protein involved in Fe transport
MHRCWFSLGAAGRVTAVVLAVLLTAGLVAPSRADDQSGSLAGRITDAQGAPLGGANLTLVEIRRGAVSQLNGEYTIPAVPPGSYTLEVRLLGYRSNRKPITVAAGEHASMNFALEADPLEMEGVVVTGTQTPRVKLESTVAVTTLTPKDVAQAAPRSTTEMLRYVPGFTRVESSGGEVNQNITMRGILGVEYVMFMEDGLPVFPTMHTFFMNADNLIRPDENLERIEVVRGGSSALFGSNTPGAIVNLIDKTGGSELAGVAKLTGGTGGLARNDLNVSGPLSDQWRFNLGGFYRYDRGVRYPGYPGIRGGQFKGSLTRVLDKGFLRLTGKIIDDRNQFILPLPFVNPSDPRYVSGFTDYGAMNTNEGLDLRVPIPTGELELPLDDGLRTKGSWLTADLGLDFENGWKFENAAQLMQDDQSWNAILPFDAMTTADFATQQIQRLAAAGLVNPNTATYRYFYTNHFDEFGKPAAFDTPNGLVSPGGEWHVEKPLSAFQDQLQLKKSSSRGNLGLGVYFANYTQENRWFFTDILTDVRDNPRFVDLVVYDGTDTIHVTKDGFRNFLSNYVNGAGQSTIVSGVLGGELQMMPKLRADAGVRWEYNDYVQSAENTANRDLDGSPRTPYDVEPWGDGTFRHFARSLDDWAGSLGLNYKLSDHLAAYAQGSRGYKMPALDEFLVAAAEQQVDLFAPRRTLMGEAGIKYFTDRYGLAVNGFYGRLKNISGQGAVVDTATGRVIWQVRTSPENNSYGAEIEAQAQATKALRLLASATILKAELGAGAGADIGSWLNGVPPVIGNASATYTTAGVTLLGDLHYVGRRFSDVSVGTRLPAYAYTNFGVSYRFQKTPTLVSVDLLNATQSKGLEEGNPRLTGARPVFFARPLLPRRLTVALQHTF